MRALLFLTVLCLYYKSAAAYWAAVVEFHPSNSSTPSETIRRNLNDYRNFVERARAQGVQIIVFPEYGLTTLVDDPTEYAIEINTNDGVIQELSAIALEHNLYLVVNLLEKVQEPNRSTQYYNTDLVFGRNGSIILTYRKINLFAEPRLTPGLENQTITFTTDFQVTFAIFTCFDILANNPSRTVLADSQVTDVINPSAWYSTMPFYTSLSVQHGYSISNGVNLLVSNYGEPKNTHGGSGIYLADGKIAETFIDDTSSSKLLVREVPQKTQRVDKTTCTSLTPFGLPGQIGQTNISNFITRKDFNAYQYKFQKIDITKHSFNTRICDGEFCCNFDIVIDNTDPTTSTGIYKVAVFYGNVDFDRTKAHVRFCSLLVCENDSDESCGARVNTTTKFTKITVTGNLNTNNETFYAPVTLNYNLQPLSQINYCSTFNQTNSTFIKVDSTKLQQGVQVFGIWGRAEYSSATQMYSLVSLVFLGILKCILFK